MVDDIAFRLGTDLDMIEVLLFSPPDVRSFPTLQRKLTFLEKVSGKGSLVSRNVRVHTSRTVDH